MSKWRKLLKQLKNNPEQLSQLEELLKNPEADPDAISNIWGLRVWLELKTDKKKLLTC